MAPDPRKPGTTREQIERAVRLQHPDAEPSDPPQAWPPPVREGVGSSGLARGSDYAMQQHSKAFANVWKIVGIILAALAAGFGGAKAITPDYSKKIDQLATKIDENEKARQADQKNNEVTFATLQGEINLINQALHVQQPLNVSASSNKK